MGEICLELGPSDTLGILGHSSENEGLRVERVLDGTAAHRWNLSNPRNQLEHGDVVLAANGKSLCPAISGKDLDDYVVDGTLVLYIQLAEVEAAENVPAVAKRDCCSIA